MQNNQIYLRALSRSFGVASSVKFPPSPPFTAWLHSQRTLAVHRGNRGERPGRLRRGLFSSPLRAVWPPRGCLSLLKQSGHLLDLLGRSGPLPADSHVLTKLQERTSGKKNAVQKLYVAAPFSCVARIFKLREGKNCKNAVVRGLRGHR